MSDDRDHDEQAGAPTRLDADPAQERAADAATRLDPQGFATRVDPRVDATRIDGSDAGHGSLVNLPAALADRFEIERPLPAPGAEADLLLVRARADGERYVAKVYRFGTQPKSEVLEAVSRSNPEHVIGLFEHGVSSGRAFELLEYAPFGSLRDLYPGGKAVDTETVRRVLIELADALQHLHQQGVIHRDLKPANVLVRSLEPFDLVLTDFGIASASAATVHYTSAHRTIAYAAPETIAGEVSAASDYWALGIIVAELVTGRHALHGMSEIVMQARLVSHDVPTRQLPAPWDDLCAGLLQRDPRARWRYDRIQAWIRGEGTREPGRRFKLPDIDWRGVIDAVPSIKLPRMPGRSPAPLAGQDGDAAGAATEPQRSPDPEPTPATGPETERRPDAPGVRAYTFDQGRYDTPAALAAALARNPGEAHKHTARGYVGKWLADEWRDYDLANRVQDLAERYANNPEVLVLAVTIHLDPSRQASFREIPLARDGLVEALRSVVLKPSPARLAAVDDLFEHDVVGVIAQARRDEDLTTDARTWRQRWVALNSALVDLRPAVGLVSDVAPPDTARAMLLLAGLDTTYVTQLKNTAGKLLETNQQTLAAARKAIERYRRTHPDPVAVDVAVLALHGAKQVELDTGSASQRLLEEADTLDTMGVLRLLEAGANVDGPKPEDITPLMVAARYNPHAEVVGIVHDLQEALQGGARDLMAEAAATGMQHQQHLVRARDPERRGGVGVGEVLAPRNLYLEVVVAGAERADLLIAAFYRTLRDQLGVGARHAAALLGKLGVLRNAVAAIDTPRRALGDELAKLIAREL